MHPKRLFSYSIFIRIHSSTLKVLTCITRHEVNMNHYFNLRVSDSSTSKLEASIYSKVDMRFHHHKRGCSS